MDPKGASSDILLLVGACPPPALAKDLLAKGASVLFYGEGVNNSWSGERQFYYLLQDVEGRGRVPFSQCLTDEECVKRLLSARKVFTF